MTVDIDKPDFSLLPHVNVLGLLLMAILSRLSPVRSGARARLHPNLAELIGTKWRKFAGALTCAAAERHHVGDLIDQLDLEAAPHGSQLDSLDEATNQFQCFAPARARPMRYGVPQSVWLVRVVAGARNCLDLLLSASMGHDQSGPYLTPNDAASRMRISEIGPSGPRHAAELYGSRQRITNGLGL